MRHWLSRLAFSFIVVAAVLAWTGYKAGAPGADPAHAAAYYIGASLCAALGLAGLVERHRH